MGSVLKYQTLFFATFFLIGSFLVNAQKSKKDYSDIYEFDRNGEIVVAEGYRMLGMKDKPIIYKVDKWQPVKIEGGITGFVKIEGKGDLSKISGVSDCLECKKCDNDKEVCVIKENNCACQKKDDCNCKPNEVCVNGSCQLKHKRAKKTRSISVFN